MQTHWVAEVQHAVLSMLSNVHCHHAVYYVRRPVHLARVVCAVPAVVAHHPVAGVLFAANGIFQQINHAIVVMVFTVERLLVSNNIICWALRAEVL